MHFTRVRFCLISLGYLWCLFLGGQVLLPSGEKTDDIVRVDSVVIRGNKVTRRQILEREFPFRVPDTLSYCRLNASLDRLKANLLNTGLFNLVYVDYIFTDSVHLWIEIRVVEKWYIWPVPFFYVEDTNFNTWWRDKDWSRANYGAGVLLDNFRGRREHILLALQEGFTRKAMFTYTIPFINRTKTIGGGVYLGYHHARQLVYDSENNQRMFVKLYDRYAKQEWVLKIWGQYRKRLYTTHQLQLYLYHLTVSDTVLILNPSYSFHKVSHNQWLLFKYFLKYDRRNFANYPTRGVYADMEIGWYGYYFVHRFSDYQYLQATCKLFKRLWSRFYMSTGLKGRLWLRDSYPYSITYTVGYGDYVRGYEYYVIDGQWWWINKNQFRWGVMEWKTFRLPWIKNERFGLVPFSIYTGVFFDQGEVMDRSLRNNPLSGKYLYGYGIAIDIVSYYDFVLRMEASRNHRNETGLFFHFVAAI